ncbi:Hypothetical predicted protein [Pelobates cultripes]|uniref:Uncharacterized protein n=1 Tax=Pelobates cultripes TaxID=61616 RepID=A0AAD1S0N2_PELCU|nr:Hypothetical predicted protein [Pelobates cultripes]
MRWPLFWVSGRRLAPLPPLDRRCHPSLHGQWLLHHSGMKMITQLWNTLWQHPSRWPRARPTYMVELIAEGTSQRHLTIIIACPRAMSAYYTGQTKVQATVNKHRQWGHKKSGTPLDNPCAVNSQEPPDPSTASPDMTGQRGRNLKPPTQHPVRNSPPQQPGPETPQLLPQTTETVQGDVTAPPGHEKRLPRTGVG